MRCTISVALGKGWTGLLTYLFKWVKSVTSLNLPFGLGTKKAGLTQSLVSSLTFSIMSSFNKSVIRVFASCSQCTGSFLHVCTFLGRTSLLLSNWMVIGAPFIGMGGNVSVNMSENLILRDSMWSSRVVSFLILTSLGREGKSAGSTPKCTRSNQLKIRSDFIDDDTRA